MRRLILASRSPRRDEILSLAGYKHEVVVSDADESLEDGTSARDAVALISKRKAEAVLAVTEGDRVVLAADTVVDVDGSIYGKPKDTLDARRMLERMSGGVHLVHTGITVTDGAKTFCETVTTKVYMREITPREIEGYIESGEPFDKAGSYGIQGPAGAFVEKLVGDYFNVMGLPLFRISEILPEFGIELFG